MRAAILSARLLVAAIAYFVCLALAYGALMPAVPADPTAAESPVPPALALPLAVALTTAVMSWLILRARDSGWRLALRMAVVFFGVQTLMPQSESWLFQAFPGFAAHLPAAMIPRIVAAGFIHACLWVPLAVRILGRWKASASDEGRPASTEGAAWKLAVAAGAYVILYFVFGYYVAWRSPIVRAYYGGSDPGTFLQQLGSVVRDMPWLPLAQVVRGLAWALLGWIAVRAMRGSRREKALALAALFAIVMDAGLLLPNPYMPYAVRVVHLVETASSNALLGLLVAWLFAGNEKRPELVEPRASLAWPS